MSSSSPGRSSLSVVLPGVLGAGSLKDGRHLVTHISLSIYINVCMYVCMHACMHVCMCVYTYIYIYIYIYIHTKYNVHSKIIRHFRLVFTFILGARPLCAAPRVGAAITVVVVVVVLTPHLPTENVSAKIA